LRFTAFSDFDWQTCHRVEKDFTSVDEFLELPRPIPPLRFDRGLTEIWKEGRDLTNFIVMQIGTRQRINCWHREGWREVCRYFLERHEAVVVACGPIYQELEQAEWLRKELGFRILCTRGQATWPQMADLLYRARLYVGPNTAAMHLAAACGCPVVALFGPSLEDYWYPWQIPHRIVTSRGFTPSRDMLERYAHVQKRSMSEIRADDVIAACVALTAQQTSGNAR
jgi:heptosyltransferase III